MTFPFPVMLVRGLSLQFHGSTNDISNASSYTFTDHAIGAAAADRLVIVIASARDDGSASPVIANLTIGGNAATQVKAVASTANSAQIWQLVVAAGTTATIAFDTGATCERANVSVYTIKGQVSPTADDSDSSVADPAVTSAVTVTAGGVILGGGISNGTGVWTTTGMTEDADQTIETARVVAAHLSSNTTQTPTLTFDHGATTAVCWASWH